MEVSQAYITDLLGRINGVIINTHLKYLQIFIKYYGAKA